MAKKQKETWQLYFKELGKKLINPRVVSTIVIAIWLIQLAAAKDWVNVRIGNFYNFGLFSLIGILMIITSWILYTKIFSFNHVREATPLDVLLSGLFIVSAISYVLFAWQKSKWRWAFLVVTLITFVLIICRWKIVNHIKTENTEKKISEDNKNKGYELVDLKTLYDGLIPWKIGQGAITVDERAVDYDLFDRTTTIDELYTAISRSSAKHSYVVGLEGKWGIGKTTILKSAKNKFKKQKNDQIVFTHAPEDENEDFDLWLFGSKEELIRGMYNTFLSSLGIKYNSFLSNRFFNSVSEVVAGIPKIGKMISPLVTSYNPYQNVMELKNKLSHFIQSTHKHYVMCIENLDRADDEQIIFLLKLLNTVFDLPDVTYVLLYDKDRLEEVLSKKGKVNTSFAEKVINQEIKIPTALDGSVCRKIFRNLLKSYQIPSSDLTKFDYVLDCIVDNLTSVRELKRIINSVFNILAQKSELRLNLPQVIAIQYIAFAEPKLYQTIKENKAMFVSKDSYSMDTSPLQLNKKTEDFFNNLLLKYNKYFSLLGHMFPKVRVFNQGNKNNVVNPEETRNNLKNLSICTERYFDIYFLLNENNFVDINHRIRKFIKKINGKRNVVKQWHDLLDYGHTDEVLLELGLFLTIQDIPNLKIREELSEAMFTTVSDNNFEIRFSETNKYSIILHITYLIGELDEANFIKFEKLLLKQYKTVDIIAVMQHYMDTRVGGMSDEFIKNKKRMSDFYNDFCQEILDKRINLYSDKYYSPRKIWYFIDCFKDRKNGVELVVTYLNSILSEDNVYRFLFDMMIESRGSKGWGYRFPRNGFDFDILNKTLKIRVLLENSEPQNSIQNFIFTQYKNKSKNFVYLDKPLDTNLL